jgi:hypothetical protein
LVHYATSQLSKTLKSEVKIGSVDFSPFNRFYINDILLRDQGKDTLLYAGVLKVKITELFFLKKDITLHYLGLTDAVINTKRTDSIWNYQFILDALGSGQSKKQELKLDIKDLELKNIRYRTIDQWRGEDQSIIVGDLSLSAEDIDLGKKIVSINNIKLDGVLFDINQYTGNRPDSLRPKRNKATAGELQWNKNQWQISSKSITLNNSRFSSNVKTERAPFPYFDGLHLNFSDINGEINNVKFVNDTISGDIQLSTKERSGFEVTSLQAKMRMSPVIMAFDQLKIITPYSRIGNSFSMGYTSFNDDMKDFVTNVFLKGDLKNSNVDIRDIAFFAPALKNKKISLVLNGKVNGTVSALKAENIKLEYGNNTSIKGDLSITGLPNINKTTYSFKTTSTVSSIGDIKKIIPTLEKSIGLNLSPLGTIGFKGNITYLGNDVKINGKLNTALGSASSNLTIKNSGSKLQQLIATGNIEGVHAGKLLEISSLGKVSGKYEIRGKGQRNIEFNASLNAVEFNAYNYAGVNIKGNFTNRNIKSLVNIDDRNLNASILAQVDLSGKTPRTSIDTRIFSSDLKALKFTSMPLQFSGSSKINVDGSTLDNMIGSAEFDQLYVGREKQTYQFDKILVKAENVGPYRSFSVQGNDIDARIRGHFDFVELSATFNQYFSKYYPLYFKKTAPPKRDQDLSFSFELKNATSILKILDNGMSGMNYSNIEGSIDTRNNLFSINATIPKLIYKKVAVYDFSFDADGDSDSLKMFSKASSVVFNDSLFFPNNEIHIRSAKDVSLIDIKTISDQSLYGANLSATINNLKDGINIHFNRSSLVFNDKTWNIEKDGDVIISKSLFDAKNFMITNGNQAISIITLPPEANRKQTIILSLDKVNLGDILPFVIKQPRIQGITTGDITLEDPFKNLKMYLNAQTDKTRFEEDSIGITTLNAFWDSKEKRASYFFESNNPNYQIDVNGKLDLNETKEGTIETDINIDNLKLGLLKPYLGVVFSNLEGFGNGKLKISGSLKEPDLIGSVKVTESKVTIASTQCTYQLQDPIIEFKPDMISFGEIQLKDIYGNSAVFKGDLEHHFFRRFGYNLSASSKKLLVLNTTKANNELFYGKAIARFNFNMIGPEQLMRMYVSGLPVDSSTININTSTSSKQSAEVDYILWKSYGVEMKKESFENSSNLVIDLDLTATPLLKMNVILDELTGDIISGVGNGNLKIHTGTKENLSMIGRYNIESGNYNFNFQDIFKKPFKLEGGGSSYISWTGDPLDADINVNATYLAEKVRMSTLFTDASNSSVSGVSSDVLREISDVEVRCNLTGTLSKLNPNFQIVIPQNSAARTNSTIDSRLKNINRDQLEVSKQATYLIVFKSFAPQSAIVANDLNSQLINTTISGVINGILSSSVQNFFSKVLGSSVDVNFNYSRNLTSITGSTGTTGTSQNNFRENVSLQFIKSIMDDKLIITFGSDFNFATASNNSIATSGQTFLFLPDVNVQYKITPDGMFRTSFFYRSSFVLLSTSGKRNRTGGNISFRTEFDRMFGTRKRQTEVVQKEK